MLTWVDMVTAAAQVTFWITVATVTVLTFRHARRTVLQPLRTEVFKLQLEEMRTVLQMFVGREEMQLRNDAHLGEMFEASAALMFDSYAETRFPVKVGENRPYSVFSTWAMKPEALELADDDIDAPEPGTVAAWEQQPWEGYRHLGIPIPDEHLTYTETIQRMIENPILPSRCAQLLKEYLDLLGDNREHIGRLMEKAAPEMLTRYDSLDRLRAANLNWLHNMWNAGVTPLKSKADEISVFARAYFKADDFVEMSNRRSM
jgi:hypothetical protein